MTHITMARDLLALLCVAQGLATVVIDLSRTHASNPLWLGHARFHVVWQTTTVAFLAMFEVGLVFAPGPFRSQQFYFAAALAAMPMLGFWVALVTRAAYGGALSDPNGIPPLFLKFPSGVRRVDMNVAAEVLGIILLIFAVALYRVL